MIFVQKKFTKTKILYKRYEKILPSQANYPFFCQNISRLGIAQLSNLLTRREG